MAPAPSLQLAPASGGTTSTAGARKAVQGPFVSAVEVSASPPGFPVLRIYPGR